MRIAQRMTKLRSFIVMDILEAALELETQGVDVVHLEIGEPDYDPPRVVLEALHRAVSEGHTHYTHSLGVWRLREAVAAWYEREYGVIVEPERVVITPGSSGAFLNALASLLDIGERVALTDPGYPCYPNFARLLGAEPISVFVEAADGFVPRREQIKQAIADGAVAVLLASPANPTGAVLPNAELEWLCQNCPVFISDELYHGLTYEGVQAQTALKFSEDVIVINGFSKRFAMTGLRIGWAVVPRELVREFQKLNQNLFICPDSISQQAAIAALEDPSCSLWLQERLNELAQRRRVLIDGLRRLGFGIEREPQGAFYVFADAGRFCEDSFEFTREMLTRAHVAATPGIDFGRHRTQTFVRFAYTTSVERIEEAISRIERWLEQRG